MSRNFSRGNLCTHWLLCDVWGTTSWLMAPIKLPKRLSLPNTLAHSITFALFTFPSSSQGWEYSAVMFICVNTVSLLFIGASYIKMLRAIKQTSAEAMRPTLSGRENVVARRFAVIVATDCACWLPIIIVKMAALTGKQLCRPAVVVVCPEESPHLFRQFGAARRHDLAKRRGDQCCTLSGFITLPAPHSCCPGQSARRPDEWRRRWRWMRWGVDAPLLRCHATTN